MTEEIRTNPQEIAEIIESAMREFNLAMKYREDVSNLTRKRAEQIIRFSIIGLLLLGIAMFYLLYTLTKSMSSITMRVNEASSYIENVNVNLQAVSTNLFSIRESIDHTNQLINTMPVMTQSVNQMSGDMDKIQASLDNINFNISVMPVMDDSINQMSANIFDMTGNMKTINNSITTMSNDIAKINYQLNTVNQQFIGLNEQVNFMGHNINDMSKPIKYMPFP